MDLSPAKWELLVANGAKDPESSGVVRSLLVECACDEGFHFVVFFLPFTLHVRFGDRSLLRMPIPADSR